MIVVTGATGQFGRQVVQHLLQRGVPPTEITVAARTPDKAADLAAHGVQVRQADYDRPETLATAFTGADKLLFVSANGPDDQRITQHRAVVQAAKTAHVGLVIYTSIVNADANPISVARVHRDTEGALAAAEVPTVLLRNGWYTENYTAALPGAVERGAVVGSAGDGRIASATRADLAEAAAAVLATDVPAGSTFELTGDTAWSLPELAAEARALTGKPVVYTDVPAEKYRNILNGVGLPSFLVELIVEADTRVSEGALARVTGDLADLLGRPSTTLTDAVTHALKG